jgi:glutathione S-transferase
MKLYGHPLSSCTRKVLVAFAEKGVVPEFTTVDLFAGEHKGSAYVARHPFGVVPVLEDGDFVLYESRAILRFLDARFDTPPLMPASLVERARMDQWMSVDQSYVAPHTRALAVERIVKKRRGQAPDAAVERASEEALASALAVYDRALQGREYLAGGTFSLADISLMPYVASLAMVGAEHLLESVPHVRAWWSRGRERASWRAAVGSSAQ